MNSFFRHAIPMALLATLVTTSLRAEQLVVGAADFHARREVGHSFDVGGWVEGSSANGGDGCLVASVRLPHDALVTQLVLEVYDNRVAEDFRIDLKRKHRGNSVPAAVLAGGSTFGASTAALQIPVSVSGGGHLVQDAFVYFLSTDANCLDDADHRIYAVRIDYELALFVDGFESGDTTEWGAPPQTVFSAWVSGIDFKNFAGYPWTIDSTLATFWLENSNNNPPPCAPARVELPHGATVVGFLANLWDIRGDRDLTLSLRRSVMSSGAASSVLASASTSGSAGWLLRSDFTVTDAVIDNDTYWYWLDLCPSGGNQIQVAELGVQSVQLLYSLP